MNWKQPKVYAVKHKNEKVRAESRSGGIFSALSDKVFESKGVVYGCTLNEQLVAIHSRAEDVETRNQMRGSKYVQSHLGEVFKSVRKDLDNGRKVLFSGTSCQIAGLKKFLGCERENLICIDIVCHGVPSPKLWRSYLSWQNRKNRAITTKVDFRNKRDYGWSDHVETLTMGNKSIDSRVYTAIFYSHCAMRPCCYECPYKSIMHPADITIADYWGIDKAAPGFNDNKGVSLVLINNDKGERIFEEVKSSIKWCPTKIEDSMQPPLIKAYSPPANREEFWNDMSRENFDIVAKKYGNYSMINVIKWKIGKIRRKLKLK